MRNKILILGLILLSVTTAWAGTCGNGYSFSRKVQFLQAINSTQTNFPMPFIGTYAKLKTVANGGEVQNTASNANSVTGPADLVFCDAATSGNALKYEVANYDATTGAFEIYIGIPAYSSSSDNNVWMFLNNSSVTTTQQDLSLWSDANYIDVYHFSSAALGADSLTTLPLTNTGATASTNAVWGGSAYFNGLAKMVSSATTGLGISTITLEWMGNIVANGSGNSNSYVSDVNIPTGTAGFDSRNNDTQLDWVAWYSSSVYVDRSSASQLFTGIWRTFAETVTGTTRVMYADGTSIGYGTFNVPSTMGTSVGNLAIGAIADGTLPANVYMDEVRIANVVKSADWEANVSRMLSAYQAESTYKIFEPVPTGIIQYAVCVTGNPVGTSLPCTLPFLPTSGNVLGVLTGSVNNITNASLSDTQGNTFNTLKCTANTGGILHASACINYATLGSTSADTITANVSTAADTTMIVVELVSPAITSGSTNGGISDAASSISSGSASTTDPKPILMCVGANTSGGNTVKFTSMTPATDLFYSAQAASYGGGGGASAGFGLSVASAGSHTCNFTLASSSAHQAASIGFLVGSPSGSVRHRVVRH